MSEPSMMRLKVRGLKRRWIFEVEVPANCNVSHLHERVEHLTGLHRSCQKLIFAGRTLDPALSLTAANLVEGACISVLEQQGKVATVLIPGSEDPLTVLTSGGMTLSWTGGDGTKRSVQKFREQRPTQLVHRDLGLPSLYLDFLDKCFYPSQEELDARLDGGNDNAEVSIVLPELYVSSESSGVEANIPEELQQKLEVVLNFLRDQGEAPTDSDTGWADIQRRIFRLVVARPKCDINIPKDKFGIPSDADLYIFAQNHSSVYFMSSEERDAFEACIEQLPSQESKDLRVLSVFLKVFYEGGFGYNKRELVGEGAYVPVNVGVAALSVVPSFEGQLGIATGYPYLLDHRFLPFIDTVPVTIGKIKGMSERHSRYGLCFTRCAFVWEGDAYVSDGALDFCCVLPYGGFYYVPAELGKYKEVGGLMYAFGEDKESTHDAADGSTSTSPETKPASVDNLSTE